LGLDSVSSVTFDAAEVSEADVEVLTRLRIVHINDVYILKNFAQLKTLIDQQRKGCRNMIVTLAGDFLAPSVLSSLDQGAGMVDTLGRVGVTHLCFGNHESDVPYEALRHRIEEFKGVWLNSNMPAFEPKLPEFDIIELTDDSGRVGSRCVGLLGFLLGGAEFGSCYREGAFGGGAASIVPVLEAHAAAKKHLLTSRPVIDAVVPLTHQDQREDEALAATGEYAVVLGGHDHNLTVTQHGPRGTYVVKAGQDASHAVVVDLAWSSFAPPAAQPSVTTRTLKVKGQKVDEKVLAAVQRAEAPVRELESAHLIELPLIPDPGGTGVLARPSSVNARYGPCTMAMYLAEALKRCMGVDAAFINSGAVRAERQYEDDFTYADLQKECPFPSEMVVVRMDGATLAQAVEMSRAGWLAAGGPTEESGALQHDFGCAVNARHRLKKVDGEKLDEQREYSVLLDTYDVIKNPIFAEYAKQRPERIPSADAGRPCMTILLEYFCREQWRQLGDRDGDGTITETEINDLFTECDINVNGVIACDELAKILAKRLHHGHSMMVAKQMIALADTDESGSVSCEELFHLFKKKSLGMKNDWPSSHEHHHHTGDIE